jgi:integrase
MASKGLGHVYDRNGIFWLKFYVAGLPKYESSKSHLKSDAVKLLKRRLGEVESQTYAAQSGKVLVGELLDDLLRYCASNNPKSLKTFAEPGIKRLQAEFGKRRASSLTTDQLTDYQERRILDVANATVNREMALLRRAFHLGEQATPQKVHRSPSFPMLPEDNVRKGFLERLQYEALLAELPSELKPLLVVGYHVGCRRGELIGLQVGQVDLAGSVIRLNPGETKNNEGRVLPIYGDMVDCLTAQLATIRAVDPACPWVFHRAGEPISDFRNAWEKACDLAGVPNLLFHDLRRSAVRNMERSGVPRSVAMRISGHKTESTYRRYDIVSERDITDAGARMGAYFGGQVERAAG